MAKEASFVVGRFASEAALAQAIKALRAQGYRHLDAWVPYPCQAIERALALPKSPLPRWALAGGVTGGCGAIALQIFTNAVSYPVYVGGFAPADLVACIPIAFESCVLGAVLTSALGFLCYTSLPAWWHPAFAGREAVHASRDGFLLLVASTDPVYSDLTPQHVRSHDAVGVETVHP